jgi:hypothetical protein
MIVTDFQVLMHALTALEGRAPQSDRLKIAPQPSRGTPERTSLEPGATGEGGSNALATFHSEREYAQYCRQCQECGE